MNIKSDSPQFSHLISWLKKESIQELRQFFPLNDMNTWIRRKYRSRFYAKIDLIKLKDEIYSELINPLFIKPGINVKDLFYCFSAFHKELKREISQGEFERILRGFYLNFRKIAPEANFPLSWMLNPKELSPKEKAYCRGRDKELMYEWKKLEGEIAKISEELENFDLLLKKKYIEKDEIEKEYLWWKKQTRKDYSFNQKKDAAIRQIARILNWLKIARGKPGRHTKPFNVFVYHVINKNKCTYWKYNENHKPVFHKDGQHKLERDWKLILFLILYFYFRLEGKVEIPELKKFISKNGKKPAHEVLKILKKKLWNAYKNFPRLDGWSFQQKIDETGFRKLIVNDDGMFKIVWL